MLKLLSVGAVVEMGTVGSWKSPFEFRKQAEASQILCRVLTKSAAVLPVFHGLRRLILIRHCSG